MVLSASGRIKTGVTGPAEGDSYVAVIEFSNPVRARGIALLRKRPSTRHATPEGPVAVVFAARVAPGLAQV